MKKSSWKWRRRYCAWAGVVALSFQLAVSFGQGLTISRTNGDAEVSVPLIICDLAGRNARVPLKDGSQPAPVSSYPSCPVCLVHAIGYNLAAVEQTNTFSITFRDIDRRLQITDQPATIKINTAGYPRAPPFTV